MQPSRKKSKEPRFSSLFSSKARSDSLNSTAVMKRSGPLVASVAAAASATAISSSSSSTDSKTQSSKDESTSGEDRDRSSSAEKFAPKFDGLRFIETLVTAHR